MSEADIAFARISDPADPRLDALLRLYEEAIPARERKNEAAVRAMAASPRHRVGIARDRDRLVGFFLLYVGDGIALLEYLATSPEVRGRGFGAALYAEARAAAGGRPLLIEVESDREAAPDIALRTRRIGFYRRLGARRIAGLDFVLPLPGEGPPPLLDLMIDGAGSAPVESARVGGWIREIYTGVYGCRPEDPRLQAMIAGLPPRVALD